MSQAKVNRYKEEKKNREKILKKEKRDAAIRKGVLALVGVAILGWAGYSAYDSLKPEPVPSSYEINTSALDEFLNGINAE